MKAAVTSCVLVLASCATGDLETSPTEQEAIIIHPALPSVNTSCMWVQGKNCYGVPNDGNSIWPSEMGIRSVQVLTRRGPTRGADGSIETFLAFVIWNKTTVGRIFRVDVGSTNAAHWRDSLGDVSAVRTFSGLDTSTGSTGSTGGGPGPVPGPNVVGPITFEVPYLDAVKRYAGVIDDATNAFLDTRSIAID